MFDKYFRPHRKYVAVYCEYNHLPYKLRQKMKLVQSLIMETCEMSCNHYKFICMADGCMLLDTLRNKILWTLNYNSMAVLLDRLREIHRLYRYEKHYISCKDMVAFHDYCNLKKRYYV